MASINPGPWLTQIFEIACVIWEKYYFQLHLEGHFSLKQSSSTQIKYWMNIGEDIIRHSIELAQKL